MIYLIWGLLNCGLFLFFIVICFKATKHIREKIGLFASIIFVFGLLSFVGQSSYDYENTEPNSNQIKTWKFNSEDSLKNNDSYSIEIDLEKTLISKYQLIIKFCKDKKEQIIIPISASSSKTGFISGTKWKPTSIIINKTNDYNKFNYNVIGIEEWELLGASFYTQLKEYKGIAVTK